MKPEEKDPWARALGRWNGYYHGLEPARRQRLWAAAGLMLILAGGIFLLVGRTRWAVLYTGLEARDAGAITEKLKASKVPYRLAKDGTEIQVPDAMVYEQRLALASQGLPLGQGRGYELLDENNLLLSEESARVNRLRALQGELERTILSLRGVEGVRVHLVIPERQMFSRDEQPSSASVLLKLQPGVQLDESEAAALAHLVSHAVEGLKPEAVAIIDTEGHDLGPGAGGGAAGVATHIDAARKLERHLHDQVQSLFDEALGPDQAIVRVHAELDFDDQTVSKEIYEAPTKQGGLIREEQQSSSSDGGNGNPNGAIAVPNGAGTLASNAAGNPQSQAQKGGSRSDRRVVYELNRTVQNITQGAGALKKVSVSVLLKQAFPPAELNALQDAVGKTVGLDPTRGDAMSLSVIPAQALVAAKQKADVDAAALQKAGKEQRQMMLVQALAPWAVAAVAAIFLAMLAWKALRLAAPPKQNVETRSAAAPGPVPTTAAEAFSNSAPQPAPEVELQQLVEQYPASAAEVLRRMMNN
jgi:flagellar M-ring protein FliF